MRLLPMIPMFSDISAHFLACFQAAPVSRSRRARTMGGLLLTLCMVLGLSLPNVSYGELYNFSPASGKLSSPFGWRHHPISGGSKFHAGIDIAAPSGAPILATQPGKVIYAGPYGGYGNLVLLSHGESLYTMYAHASKLLVSNGQQIVQGQEIAKVGSTGHSTGPHLHFEVHYNHKYVNPLKYLSLLETHQNQVATLPVKPRISHIKPAAPVVQPQPVQPVVHHAHNNGPRAVITESRPDAAQNQQTRRRLEWL